MSHVHTFADMDGTQRQTAYASDCDQCGTYRNKTVPATTHRTLRAILADLSGTSGSSPEYLYRELESAVRAQVEQDPDTMPAHVHGEAVVSALRHLPLYGQLPDTYTVITRDSGNPPSEPRYSVSRARFAPLLGRWSIDTDYRVESGLSWDRAAAVFTRHVASRVS